MSSGAYGWLKAAKGRQPLNAMPLMPGFSIHLYIMHACMDLSCKEYHDV